MGADRPRVVTVVNLKGGSGKTTTAMHLAGAWQASGQTAQVLDADPQGSAVAWAEDCASTGQPLPWSVLGRPSATLHREIPTLASGRAWTVIDCPPAAADHRVVRSAIRAADLVLVPCRPTAPDTRRIAPTRRLVEELAAEHDLTILFAVLLTQTRAGTLSRTLFRDAIEDSGTVVLDAEIPLRELYAWAEGACPSAEALSYYAGVTREIDEALGGSSG